ncbi:MAG TPA: universal stress protein [Caulobacteraceae bacterium]|nr:universal stress protein [Caulobacteraceae bacterium]
MDIKQIMLVVSAHADPTPAVATAAGVAARFQAVVDGLCLFHEPMTTAIDSYAVGPAGIESVLEHRDAEVRKLTTPAELAFRAAMGNERALWRTDEMTEWGIALAGCAQIADLAVVSAPGRDGAMRRMAERLILGGGVPCVIAPAAAATTFPPRRIAIGWNGSRQARRAVADAMELLNGAAEVAVVVVGQEAPGPDAAALARLLERHQVHVAVRRPHGAHGVGQTLLAEAETFGADLLVMGALGRSRAEETLLGGATHALISGGPLPIFMAH